FLAIILIFFGPGVLVFFVVASANGGWITVGFLGLSIAAIVEGRHTKNNALEFLGMLGALPALVSPLISVDYGEAITAGIYARLFLLGAFVVRFLKRRTA